MGFLDRMKSSGPEEVKTSEAGSLVAMHNLGKPVWTPRDYESFAREGYIKQVIAYRCIRTIATSASCVPWMLFDGDREITDNHPLLNLWSRPNPQMAASEFVETIVGYYLVAGNSYIEAIGYERSEVIELWPLRPDRMRVIAGAFGLPKGYEYKLGNSRKTWDADPATGRGPVLHLKTFHPVNDWYGLSPIEAAAIAIDMRNEAGNWNKALLQNSACPSGALVYEPKDGPASLTDPEFERLKAQIDKQYKGTKNAGRPMLLDGGMRWEQMGLSPKDMNWLESSNSSARDIAQALGVPPLMLGIPGDNRHSNYAEARLALWDETIIPLLENIAGEFNAWLTPLYGENLLLKFDLDAVPALAPRREKQWDMAKEGATFLTINERRALVGYEELDDGDVIMGSATTVPILGEGVIPTDLDDEDEDDDEEDDEERSAALRDLRVPKGGITQEMADRLWLETYGDVDSKPNGLNGGGT